MFTNRREAGYQLAQRLKSRPLAQPLVLGIPRGGVEVASALARELGAELDIFLSKKLGAPHQPELAIGAVSEGGITYIHPTFYLVPGISADYVEQERERCATELAERVSRFRTVKPAPEILNRSVILVDDGIATGSTLAAALETLRSRGAKEILVAVPVAPDDARDALEPYCDEFICLKMPHHMHSVGRYYQDFSPTDEEEVMRLIANSWERYESQPIARGA